MEEQAYERPSAATGFAQKDLIKSSNPIRIIRNIAPQFTGAEKRIPADRTGHRKQNCRNPHRSEFVPVTPLRNGQDSRGQQGAFAEVPQGVVIQRKGAANTETFTVRKMASASVLSVCSPLLHRSLKTSK